MPRRRCSDSSMVMFMILIPFRRFKQMLREEGNGFYLIPAVKQNGRVTKFKDYHKPGNRGPYSFNTQNYTYGFVNHLGEFLDRKTASVYASSHGLLKKDWRLVDFGDETLLHTSMVEPKSLRKPKD